MNLIAVSGRTDAPVKEAFASKAQILVWLKPFGLHLP